LNSLPELVVEQVQFFSRLETDGFSWRDADLGAGARVAADAGLAGTHVEDAEAAQLDPLALGQGAFERLEDRVDSRLGLVALQAGAFNHLVNNVLFYQGFLRSGESCSSTLIVESFRTVVNAPRLP